MSGHSKWHNIQVRKGKQDKAKSGLFTKYARMMTVAAREGGGDQTTNFSLRLAIEKAKAINMPKDNIERAIKRGTGELKDEVVLEEVLYEGFGAGGVAVMVEVVTDNKNRAAADIKHLFALHGGSMAGPGSVQWQFVRRGVIRIGDSGQKSKVQNKKSDFELAVIEAGAEDIIENEFGLEILALVEKFKTVLDAVKSYDVEPDDAGLEWVAKEFVQPDAAAAERVHALVSALDEHDDVRSVYTNAK